jgi:hypothetical protein
MQPMTTKTKETAAERRAREAVQAREAQARWEADKPARLLRALARAHDLGVDAYVNHRYDNVLYYCFRFPRSADSNYASYDATYCDPVVELTEWGMHYIENDLDTLALAEVKRLRLAEVRAQTLATLTDEQKEALGL